MVEPIHDWRIDEMSEEKTKEFQYRENDTSNPSHYREDGEPEVIDQQRARYGDRHFITHCEQCAFKYRKRAGKKSIETLEKDFEKARWYEQMAWHVAVSLVQASLPEESLQRLHHKLLSVPDPRTVQAYKGYSEEQWMYNVLKTSAHSVLNELGL